MNPNYRYPDDVLWTDAAWADREAPVRPLMDKLTGLAHQAVRPLAASHAYEDRTDGDYDAKTNVLRLPDVTGRWESRGMRVHITGMGFTSWIALVPEGVSPDPEVLVVVHNTDMTSRAWAMQALDYYAELNDAAAGQNAVILYLIQDKPIPSGIYMDILLELSAIFHIALDRLMLDLTPLTLAGEALPQGAFSWSGRPVVDIKDQWHARVAHQYIVGNINHHNPEFDLERLQHSTLGRRMAEGMRLEHDYDRADDPKLVAAWDAKGLTFESRLCRGERYMTLAPKGVERPLPLLICMKEVRDSMPFQALTALQFYYDFIDIAACGECMLLFFAMETPDDNELLLDILAQVETDHPVDRSRVYITGQSHNGYLALEFARRHPDVIAAVAQLNDRHGIAAPAYSVESLKMSDEMLSVLEDWDLPLINICGAIENVFPHTQPGSEAEEHAIDAYRRRLKAFRCPDRSEAEVAACRTSADLPTRMNGVPGDRTEVAYSMGFAAYISDVRNVDGNWHLRFVTLENLPHMISPQMAELAWSFIRRFRRADGEKMVEELY